MEKIVVITNGNYYARVILEKLFREKKESIAGILVITGDYTGKSGFRVLFSLMRKTCFPYFFAKCLQHGLLKIAGVFSQKAHFDVSSLARFYGFKVFFFRSVNENAVYTKIKEMSPSLIVSVSCPQKIREGILKISKKGGINIHSSLLPKYAGLAPYYWVLSQGVNETGTTVHYLSDSFDEGNILEQETVDIPPGTSAFGLFEELARTGSDVLLKAVEKALRSEPGREQKKEGKTYFSHPDISSYLSLRRKGNRIIKISHVMRMIAVERESIKERE